ncbi:hypothetical protein G3A49_08245 [Haloferax volcanii]|uniref:Uncharacterized protein n=2 Tax=Haloferax volcanii TaxID=2246 RepID=A0A6C0URK4_HALVO|nr:MULTISPECIES: hypothetical protein [Haloferax]ELK45799.1 hypothetical protein D320_21026 [Haloferax sp. BAB-2207]ELZ73475.1 hypothetical protein C456_11919 [Haloferax lucentense DSM 14919]NLV01930.1 hypothetical protein [Haloferax alexandrinus]QIB78122.1 hypothetical protein G3A49_08245 [Haloferax alexandrinus]TVT96527.1 hypothetical protein FQA18_00680 [Haloferax volcanii]
MVETETYTIEGPGGDTEALELPAGLVDIFAEQGEDPTDVVADVVVQAFAQQAHVVAHHSEGGAPADIAEINEQMEELFEDRFGVPLSDALGHSH